MTLGEYVRTARENQGQRLRHVAEHLKLSAGSFSRLENDRPIPFGPDTMARIFDHLGLDRWEGFRLADMADPALVTIVHQPPRALDELLRLFHDATDEEWAVALAAVQQRREKGA